MKKTFFLVFLILFQSCSFDNRLGIWQNINETDTEKQDLKGLKSLSLSEKQFDEIIPFNNKYKFNLTKPIIVSSWKDIYYNQSNNLENLNYRELNQIKYKSKKISRNISSTNILLESGNIIFSDLKGNIIVFSLDENKIIEKFNFYKKKYKKLNKSISMIVEDNIIYVSDNFGYLYAYNYKNKSVLWAKNYKIPFRSNLKIFNEKLIAANQNNNLFFFNKKTGNIIKSFPTEETVIKNYFINNISLNNEYTVFLNTYGSLYGIDNQNMNISWYINLNQSLDINPNNLFRGNQVVINNDKIFVSTNNFFYVLDVQTGTILLRKNFSTKLQPIIINNHLFTLTKNDLLVSIDLKSGDYIFSYDLNQKIANYLNTKKKKAQFRNIMFLNNKLFIFLKNSYIIKIQTNGEIEKIFKLPSKLKTNPIVANSSIFFLGSKNKLNVID